MIRSLRSFLYLRPTFGRIFALSSTLAQPLGEPSLFPLPSPNLWANLHSSLSPRPTFGRIFTFFSPLAQPLGEPSLFPLPSPNLWANHTTQSHLCPTFGRTTPHRLISAQQFFHLLYTCAARHPPKKPALQKSRPRKKPPSKKAGLPKSRPRKKPATKKAGHKTWPANHRNINYFISSIVG